MAFVFLSYARPDREIAKKLTEDLLVQGVDVWSDMDLNVGSDWVNEISRKLDEATAVLVLITPQSLQSQHVFEELTTALRQSRRVLPVLAGGVSFEELPRELSSIQGVDLDPDYQTAINEIVSSFKSLEGSHEPPPSTLINRNEIIQDVIAGVLERLKVEMPDVLPQYDTIDEKLVFVIASFQADMEPAFEAIQAAASAVGLRAQRVKDVTGDYKISDRMLMMIRQAKLIVADLTHERPNVYFELGYARGLGKTVITIMRDGSNVHFDVQDWTYLPYIDSRPLERELIERFNIELSRLESLD
jgi:hypothetical protein